MSKFILERIECVNDVIKIINILRENSENDNSGFLAGIEKTLFHMVYGFGVKRKTVHLSNLESLEIKMELVV